MKNNTKEYWDAVYEKSDGKYNTLFQESVSLLKKFGFIKGVVVDLGCGKGELVQTLFDSGLSATGYDISSIAIEKGKLEFPTIANRLFVGDITKIPQNNDTIILHMVYAFIENKKDFLNQVKDKLSPEGTFIIGTPIRTLANCMYVSKPEVSVTEEDVQIIKDNFDIITILKGKYPVGDFMFIVAKK